MSFHPVACATNTLNIVPDGLVAYGELQFTSLNKPIAAVPVLGNYLNSEGKLFITNGFLPVPLPGVVEVLCNIFGSVRIKPNVCSRYLMAGLIPHSQYPDTCSSIRVGIILVIYFTTQAGHSLLRTGSSSIFLSHISRLRSACDDMFPQTLVLSVPKGLQCKESAT